VVLLTLGISVTTKLEFQTILGNGNAAVLCLQLVFSHSKNT